MLLDIGATSIRQGLLSDPRPTTVEATPESIHDTLDVLTDFSSAWSEFTDVVVAVPGLVTASGYVEQALYSPIKQIDLAAFFESQGRARRLIIMNDAKVQAHSLLESAGSLVHITIGTAVGGALISSKAITGGSRNFAGEIGHITVSTSNLQCPCGRIGCLDTQASGWSLQRDLGQDWWRAAPEKYALRLARAGESVGDALRSVSMLLDVDGYSIAGRITGFAEFSDALQASIADVAIEQVASEPDSWQITRRGANVILMNFDDLS